MKELAFTITQPKGFGVQVQGDPNATLSNVISNALTIVFVVAAIIFLFMVVWGALQWIVSGGDKDAVANARKRITNAIIGIVILALAFLIVVFIGRIVNIDLLGKLPIPSLGDTP